MKRLTILFVLLAGGLFAREAPPRLQIDVDFFDNLAVVKPYCGSNWIDRFFADCKAHGVKRVTWRCFAQIANYPTKLNYMVDAVQTIRSAADERRFAPQTLEGLRVTVTRGGHPTCLVLRAIQAR